MYPYKDDDIESQKGWMRILVIDEPITKGLMKIAHEWVSAKDGGGTKIR